MHLRFLALLLVLMNWASCGSAQFVYVPWEAEHGDGNTNSYIPMAESPNPSGQTIWYVGPIRYQQVYDATAFSDLPEGGAFLAAIWLRLNCRKGNQDVFFVSTNFQIDISTTLRKPDGLSQMFSENIGLDNINAFGPGRYLIIGSARCPLVSSFAFNAMQLAIPFFYNPRKANLLLDFRNGGSELPDRWIEEKPSLDAVDIKGDSVSRVASLSLTNDTADIVDTLGLVTVFTYGPVPKLKILRAGGELLLSWPDFPPAFALETTRTLDANPAWTPYTGTIEEQEPNIRTTRVQIADLAGTLYFRLFWNSPQVGIPQPTAEILPAQLSNLHP